MSADLRVGDCLTPNWLRVDGFQRYREVMQAASDLLPDVFAVFNDSEEYLGLVDYRQAALFPNRIFADLLVRRPAPPIIVNTLLDQVLPQFHETRSDHLAVVDEAGQFVGVISELSLFSTLIEKVRQELDYHRMATMVFETTSEGILVTDSTPRIIQINRAFSETTGYSPEEVLGKNPNILHSGRQNAEFYKAMWKTVRETGKWEGELWNRRKNGEIYPEWLHINSILDDNGKVTHYIGVFSDIGPNKEIQHELQRLAYYDSLTGLPNRRLFLDRLERAIAHSHRMQDGFAVLFIDLNRFKNINDAYGHELGDSLLQAVAQRIRSATRESDTVARLGGDEYVAILHDCHDAKQCLHVAEKVQRALNEPLILDGHNLNISAAIGISRYPEDGLLVADIIRNADLAMYRAKQDGLGVSFFQSDMHAGIVERLEIEGAIQSGLRNGEFWLAWQPQVHLQDRTLSGAEILARWQHKEQDIPPGTFIPIAESAGLIDKLGDWVFCQAMDEAVDFIGQHAEHPFKIAVNFSPLQLKGKQAFQRIAEMLEAKGLPPSRLVMEVTESVLMSQRLGSLEFLSGMSDLGVSIAVDDFGTGYSNLANLKLFHVDKLKIDQSFVNDLEQNATSRQIVQAIIEMAHHLNIKVLAEGIENEAQFTILRDLGCDYGQGYLFSRPIPLDQLKSRFPLPA